MWEEAESPQNQEVVQQIPPQKHINSALTVKNIHQILPRGVTYDGNSNKTAFRNLEAEEDEENIEERKSPNFKRIWFAYFCLNTWKYRPINFWPPISSCREDSLRMILLRSTWGCSGGGSGGGTDLGWVRSHLRALCSGGRVTQRQIGIWCSIISFRCPTSM